MNVFNEFMEMHSKIIDRYSELLSAVYEICDSEKSHEEFYAESNRYKYYIVYPYDDVELIDGRYVLRHRGYDVVHFFFIVKKGECAYV